MHESMTLAGSKYMYVELSSMPATAFMGPADLCFLVRICLTADPKLASAVDRR